MYNFWLKANTFGFNSRSRIACGVIIIDKDYDGNGEDNSENSMMIILLPVNRMCTDLY